MKSLRNYILEQVAAGKLAKDVAAQMLAELVAARSNSPSSSSTSTEIAIIGMACRFPPSNDLEGFWASLAAGTDLIRTFPESRSQDINAIIMLLDKQSPGLASRFNRSFFDAAFLDRVDQFDYSVFRIAPEEARIIDPQQRILLEVVLECIENAGYSRERLNGSKMGVYMAYSESDYEHLIPHDQPSCIHATLPAMLAGRISYIFNWRGPSQVIETTCSSSLVALHNACQAILTGDCETALVGGVQLLLLPFAESHADIQQIGISSPDGRTRAFDIAGNGAGNGEGSGVVMLKPLSKAIEDRDYIHAIIKGSAVNSDGKSSGLTAPNPEAQCQVITEAWRRAGIDPATISYIEAHGTATKLGDPIEIQGITNAFRQYTDRRAFCAIGSVKTNIGHLSAAAGIAGLIKTVLSLKFRQLPPSLHFKDANPLIQFTDSPVFVNDTLRPWNVSEGPRRAGVSSFGLSGTNCHMILEEYTEQSHSAERERNIGEDRIFTLSATSQSSLVILADKFVCFLSSAEAQRETLDDICYTANTGRDTYAHRLAIIASSIQDLAEKLVWALKQIECGEVGFRTTDCIYYGLVEQQKANFSGKSALIDRSLSLREAVDLYMGHTQVRWDAYYADQAVRKIPLPTYAFVHHRCWIPAEKSVQALLASGYGFVPEGSPPSTTELIELQELSEDKTNWLYTLSWLEEPLITSDVTQSRLDTGIWLVLVDELGLANELSTKLHQVGCGTILVYPGLSFQQKGEQEYQVRPKSQDDWRQLFEHLDIYECAGLTGIVHMWTCKYPAPNESLHEGDQEDSQQNLGVFSLFALFKQVIKMPVRKPFDVWIVSNYVQRVTGDEETLFPEKASLWGLSKVISQEYFWAQCYCLDIGSVGQERGQVAEIILSEMFQEMSKRDPIVAYRQRTRFIQQIERANLANLEDRVPPVIKEGGVYLLAGGAGKIGLGIAKYLTQQARVNLVLINRTSLPHPSEWQHVIASGNPQDKIVSRLLAIQEIEKLGSEVTYFAADIGDHQAMARVIESVVLRYGRINGVINATMEVKEKKLEDLSQEQFELSVLNRIRGAYVLNHITRAQELDFFFIISSLSSIFGGTAQADDVSANLFLDAYGAWMGHTGQEASVLNLPGIFENRPTSVTIAERILPPISSEDLIELFAIVSKKKTRFIFIEDFDFREIKHVLPILRVRFAQSLLAEKSSGPQHSSKSRVAETGPHSTLSIQGVYAHSNTLAQQIADIWSRVLGYAEIGINENFFELGGDSLMAMRVVENLLEGFDISVTIADLFESPTIAELACCIESRMDSSSVPTSLTLPPVMEPLTWSAVVQDEEIHQAGQGTPLVLVSATKRAPLSFIQEKLWFFDQLVPGNPVNNIAMPLRIVGQLNVSLVVQCINEIVRRHEILRTTFALDRNQPVQRVAPELKLQLNIVDLQELPDTAQEAEVRRLASETVRRPFDLAHGPLLRGNLLRLNDKEQVIALAIHHIVFDGWSMGVFIGELATLYEAFSLGLSSPLPPLPFQYADFAQSQRQRLQGQAFDDLVAFWRQRLVGATAIELPADYPRSQQLAFQGEIQPMIISPAVVQDLKNLSRQENVTLFITLLAAFFSLLHLYTQQDDLVIGVASANRNWPASNKLIGVFVNTLILRVNCAGVPSFRELLTRVRQVVLEAFEHQALTFEQILEAVHPMRNPMETPLIRVVFDFHTNPLQDKDFQGLAMTLIDIDQKTERYDLTLEITDDGEQELSGFFSYNTSIFKPTTIARMARQLETFLHNVAYEPDISI